MAKPDVNLTLAKAAVLLANALFLSHFALHAEVFLARSRAGTHKRTVPLESHLAEVPMVTTALWTSGCMEL